MMMKRCALLVALLGCGGSSGANEAPPDTRLPGTCAVDADCPDGQRCNEAGQCFGGCGETLDLTYVPPNFMVVLDRSCSMDKPPSAQTTQTKWATAVGALGKVLTDHATDVHWGLTLFPDTTGDTCGQDANAVPLGANHAATIGTLLTNALVKTDALFPKGPCVTNIDTGLQAAALDPALATTASYLMLVTDGAQSACTLGGGDAGSEAIVTDLFTNRGIKTFVVGFGGAVDAAELNKLAMLGGAPQTGATKYYRADTAAQLDTVFAQITELVVSCSYTVDPAPPDVAQTYVFFENSELVPHDPAHAAGWDYDAATMKLTLYGTYCERLQTRAVDDVDVVFGCPVPPVL
jgi:von Willebrand factor type A domain